MCLALAIVSAGCLPPAPRAGVDPKVTVSAGVAPAPVELGELRWRPGLHEALWKTGSQGLRSSTVWIPDAPRPGVLVIALHGSVLKIPGRRNLTAEEQTRGLSSCLVAPALARLDPLIIAPHSADGQWWKRVDTEYVLGLVAAAHQRWPELERRSVILGYSNGGIATWYFARLYPEYFSAAIPMAFNETVVGESPLPIYAIQGQKDELFSVERVRAAIFNLQAAGADVAYDERYRGRHMDACGYLPELTRAARWLEEHAFTRAPAGLDL